MLVSEQIKQLKFDKASKRRATPKQTPAFEPIVLVDVEVGPFAVQPPRRSSAKYRKLFRRACQDIEVEVLITFTDEPILPLRTVAEVRQRRRQSWRYRHDRGSLRGALVTSTLRGGPVLRRLLSMLDVAGDESYLVEITP